MPEKYAVWAARRLTVRQTPGITFEDAASVPEAGFIALQAIREVAATIDRRYPLHEVPEAIRYLGWGHLKGMVVITM